MTMSEFILWMILVRRALIHYLFSRFALDMLGLSALGMAL